MTLIPKRRDDGPYERPEPYGFPPRRKKEALELTPGQDRFVNGYSFYGERTLPSYTTRLFPYQPPAIVFIVSMFSAIVATLVLAYFNYRGWQEPIQPFAAVRTVSATSVALSALILIALVLVLISGLRAGRTSRRLRWMRYEWASFSDFARSEGRMQMLGFVWTIALFLLALLFLGIFLH